MSYFHLNIQETTKTAILDHCKTELSIYIPIRQTKKNESNIIKHLFTTQVA